MILPFLKKLEQKLNQDPINKNLDQQYECFRDQFYRLHQEARTRYNRADLWGKFHLLFGFLASLTSLISLILTLSSNTQLIVITSSISAISAAILTVFNPSMRATKLLSLKELCQSTEIEFISIDTKFNNSINADEKIILLESMNKRLEQIIKKINEPY